MVEVDGTRENVVEWWIVTPKFWARKKPAKMIFEPHCSKPIYLHVFLSVHDPFRYDLIPPHRHGRCRHRFWCSAQQGMHPPHVHR